MKIPDNLLYTKDHEWIEISGNTAIIGITEYAQGELGDIIFIEFPKINDKFLSTDIVGTIEAVKTVADLFSPLNCSIIEINNKLEENPEYVNNDPYGKGWIIKVQILDDNKTNLLTPNEYKIIIS